MIDPKFMDETLGIDRKKVSERYKQLHNPDSDNGENKPVEKPKRQIQFQMTEDSTEFNREAAQQDVVQTFQAQEEAPLPKIPQQPKQEEDRPKLARPGKAAATDGQVFMNGPLESEILAWKKQFGRVYSTELDGEIYIWRTINRFEYKEVMSVSNTNELMREEMICEVCVLFPYDYTYEKMTNDAGGIPSMLSEQIMQKSGFTRRAKITML